MARIEDLIQSIAEPRLREDFSREVKKLKATKKFGLVFEEHLPETTRVPSLNPQVGDTVAFRAESHNELWRVVTLKAPAIELCKEGAEKERKAKVDEVVVVRRFGEAIYPTLIPLNRVQRSPDKPRHTLIQADNYHALQLLLYTCEEKVDVIYIDPPYNTGARDWKYNNDYVDATDQWGHSKWLAMMKRRLLLAKRLLKPDGVLICTIDDYENATLSLLLDELFPERSRLPIVIRYNRSGSPRFGVFRVHEYAHILTAVDLCNISQETYVTTRNFRRNGNNSTRIARPTMFFPMLIAKGSLKLLQTGKRPADNFHPKSQTIDKGKVIEVWPIDDSGTERIWSWSPKRVLKDAHELTIKEKNGRVDLYFKTENVPISENQTVWAGKEFDAATHGSSLVQEITGVRFPFPKSIYAVKRCLELVLKNRPQATILDFFAGSGTTYHATALLNAEDGGIRRCIMVTNNEVTEKMAGELNAKQIFPGDAEFEKHGICESVTWPRSKHATEGTGHDNTPLSGTYLNGREMREGFEENVEYFRLDFVDPNAVARGDAFEAILPILWMMAGCRGERESSRGSQPWFIPKNNAYAVLLRESHFVPFCKEVRNKKGITHVFLVTDSEDSFRDMASHLDDYETMMLYKSYLETFRINTAKTNED